jgi:hypothetical protein
MSRAQSGVRAPIVFRHFRKNSGMRLFFQTIIARAYPRLIGQ